MTISQQLLDRNKAKIDTEIQQIQVGLNELKNDELRISRQISTAQESVEKARNEGKHKFSQVLTLLTRMNEHGGQYAGTRSQLEKYADFVQGFIVNST